MSFPRNDFSIEIYARKAIQPVSSISEDICTTKAAPPASSILDIDSPNPFESIPVELIDFIFSFLNTRDLKRCAQTCKGFKACSENDHICKRLWTIHFNVPFVVSDDQ